MSLELYSNQQSLFYQNLFVLHLMLKQRYHHTYLKLQWLHLQQQFYLLHQRHLTDRDTGTNRQDRVQVQRRLRGGTGAHRCFPRRIRRPRRAAACRPATAGQ